SGVCKPVPLGPPPSGPAAVAEGCTACRPRVTGWRPCRTHGRSVNVGTHAGPFETRRTAHRGSRRPGEPVTSAVGCRTGATSLSTRSAREESDNGMESQHVAPEKVAQRTLGYGNNAYLVVFRYNVPTATLTLLWSEGKADRIGWMPLLPRSKKK